MGRWLYIPESRRRAAPVPGGSELQIRSHPATGAEPQGMGRTAVRDLRDLRTLLQRLSLAEAASRKPGSREDFPYQRKSLAADPGRIPEYFQPAVLFSAQR